MSVSAWFLLFPYIPANVTTMQFWTVIHAVIAMLFIAAMMAHIYIGTVGHGGRRSMRWERVEVDLNWAKEHPLALGRGRAGKGHARSSTPRAMPAE